MKTIINLLVFFITVSVVSAQPLLKKETPLQKKLKEIYALNHPTTASYLKTNPVKRLDSLVVDYDGIYSYYNGFGLKITYEYDNLNNSAIERRYRRQDSITPYVIYDSEEWVSNTNEQLIQQTYFRNWDESTSSFNYGYQNQYSYTNNQVSEEIKLNWDGTTQTWNTWQKQQKTYDTSGKLTEVLIQNWLNNQWTDSRKQVYTYNTNNQVSLMEEFRNPFGAGWIVDKKTEYTYNTNNDLVQELNSEIVNSNFENSKKLDVIYLSAGQQIAYEYYYWDNNTWDTSSKIERFYDQTNNLTSQIFYDGFSSSTTFDIDYKEIFTYDNALPYSELQTTLEEWECKHQLITYQIQRLAYYSGQLESYLAGFYYWTDLATGIEEPVLSGSEHITAYPNPASSLLYFELPQTNDPATVELYNAAGQRVISTELSDNSLPLTDLPTGFYSYLVRQNGKAYSGKIIVE